MNTPYRGLTQEQKMSIFKAWKKYLTVEHQYKQNMKEMCK